MPEHRTEFQVSTTTIDTCLGPRQMMTAEQLSIATEGLSEADVRERVVRGDVNDVPDAPTRTMAQIVRANVFTRFNALLGSMLVLILWVGPANDALFGLVLVANSGIGIVQEIRAKRTLDRLSVLAEPKARVVRAGAVREVPIGQVVLDDVVGLRPGDQIVVDGEVLSSDGLEIDESLLTGEADPVSKGPGDRVLSGSFVAAGSGRSVATAVGRGAYAVQLAEQARRFTLVRSELRAGIDRILRLATWVLVPTAVLLFASQLRLGAGIEDGIRGAVAGTVAMVPEGLVLLMSLAFALGAIRLARKRTLVQELAAVEGLARVDVVAVDKTGTLTEGRIEVERVVPLDGGDPGEEALAALAAADEHPNATLVAIGERFPAPTGGWEVAGAVHFSSARKWSGASFDGRGTWVLGAPDVLLRSDPDGRVARRARELAEAGHRVVMLARTPEPLDGEILPGGLTPVSLIALGDRIRADAGRTLAYFRKQGVAVKVISGDHPATVAAIAARLGMEGADRAVDARELPDDPEALAGAMERHTIFGRVTPRQKRAMVKAMQSRGHVVAMTGDGVNDVLALKDADIGIAMGSGSSATRAVAQLVLLDSTFDPLPLVVDEGRRVLANIERTSNLYVVKTVYATLLALATGVFTVAFPFLPRHLTLIGALTIGIPSFFLALAPNDQRFRPGFLSRVARFAIPAGILAGIATFAGYGLVRGLDGLPLVEERTVATMVLGWIGLLILSIVAAPFTRWTAVLVSAMAAAFVAVLLLPPGRQFFELQLPPTVEWLAALGIGAVVWTLARLFLPAERPAGVGASPGVFEPVHAARKDEQG
jgi:cation-transporting ATPase E